MFVNDNFDAKQTISISANTQVLWDIRPSIVPMILLFRKQAVQGKMQITL